MQHERSTGIRKLKASAYSGGSDRKYNMWRKFLLLPIALVLISCGKNFNTSDSQNVSNTEPEEVITSDGLDKISPDTAIIADDFSFFIPDGYTVLDSSWGDLNLDEFGDLALVLKKDDEEKNSDPVYKPEKRPLLLILGRADGKYALAAKNDNLVYCVNCGGTWGDPFVEINIIKGHLMIEHYGGSGWRWTRSTSFKYSPQDKIWYLNGDGGENYHAVDTQLRSSEFRTEKDFGRIRFENFSIY